MSAVKIMCRDNLNGSIATREVDCTDVGPFAVHQSVSPTPHRWTITHRATGYAATHCRTKAIATRVARELGRIDCWDFHDVAAVKQIDSNAMARIGSILRRATHA